MRMQNDCATIDTTSPKKKTKRKQKQFRNYLRFHHETFLW